MVQQFVKVLFLFMVLFEDNGIGNAIQSVVVYSESSISVTWKNGVSHTLNQTGWDRGTRRGIDYMSNRLFNYDCVTRDSWPLIPNIHIQLKKQRDAMTAREDHLRMLHDMDGSEASFQDHALAILSTCSVLDIESLYHQIAINTMPMLKNEYHPDEQLIYDFFSVVDYESGNIMKKITMHQVLNRDIQSNLLEKVNNQTVRLVQELLKNPTVRGAMQRNIQAIMDHQVRPFRLMLNVILGSLNWNV